MDIIFTHSGLPAAVAIRFFTGGCPYHHCGLIVGDKVFESRFMKGVIATPLDEFKARGPYAIKRFELNNEQAAIDFCHDTKGAGYDLSGAIGHPFGGLWSNPLNWYCSEHANKGLAIGGLQLFENAKSIVPRDLFITAAGVTIYDSFRSGEAQAT